MLKYHQEPTSLDGAAFRGPGRRHLAEVELKQVHEHNCMMVQSFCIWLVMQEECMIAWGGPFRAQGARGAGHSRNSQKKTSLHIV